MHRLQNALVSQSPSPTGFSPSLNLLSWLYLPRSPVPWWPSAYYGTGVLSSETTCVQPLSFSYFSTLFHYRGFPSGSVVEILPARQEPRVPSWTGKIPWSRKCNPSSILAWRIPWTEEPGRLLSMGLQRITHDWATKNITPTLYLVSNRSGLLTIQWM